jgi:hypothetical protein
MGIISIFFDFGNTNYLLILGIDFLPSLCYIEHSDRVAETCEARDRGRTCWSLPLL